MMDTAMTPEWDGMSEHAKLDRRIAHVDGDALGVAITDNRIYLGGHYDVNGAGPRRPLPPQRPRRCASRRSRAKNPNIASDDTARPHKHLVAFHYDGNIDPTWTPQANTPEGPTTLLAGPNALYLGGNFTRLMTGAPRRRLLAVRGARIPAVGSSSSAPGSPCSQPFRSSALPHAMTCPG